jgi:hypothetical protein
LMLMILMNDCHRAVVVKAVGRKGACSHLLLFLSGFLFCVVFHRSPPGIRFPSLPFVLQAIVVCKVSYHAAITPR